MAVCEAMGIDYKELPNTVDEAVGDLRKLGNLMG
jgi:hypothetical protein